METSDPQQLLERIKFAISSELDIPEEDIRPDSTFSELGAESLDLLHLIMMFEDALGISIPLEDAITLLTVKDVLNYANQRSQAN